MNLNNPNDPTPNFDRRKSRVASSTTHQLETFSLSIHCSWFIVPNFMPPFNFLHNFNTKMLDILPTTNVKC